MKNVLQPVHIIDAGDMSGDLVSDVVGIAFLDNISVQLVFTGNAVGDFGVEVSLNYREQQGYVINPGDWVALPLSPAPVAAGSADDITIDINQVSAPYIRVTYTRTSGTGTVEAYLSGKAV
jgi:hypothetical protein